jgi:hypothetical protein
MPSGQALGPHPIIAFSQQWLRLWQRASVLGSGGLAAATLFHDHRQLRSRWLAELTQNTDRYLRSSVFLDLMRSNLRTMTVSTGLLHANRPR